MRWSPGNLIGLYPAMGDLYSWLDRQADSFFSYLSRHAVSILVCLAVNLLAVVVLLSLGISSRILYPPSEVELLIPADGESPAEMEGMASETPTREAIDALTRTADIRNTARDLTQSQELNAGLHDEKNIDAEKLYSDAQRAREQMLANREMALARESGGMDDAALTAPNTQTTSTEVPPERMHRGPSVVSYSLPGRSARAIPVPAYQCEGGGMVVVIIGVDPQGYVTRVAVDAERSSHDPCLQQAALAAARGSLFSVEAQAPRMSPGSITYLFVAQ